jgi:hypothetical protein
MIAFHSAAQRSPLGAACGPPMAIETTTARRRQGGGAVRWEQRGLLGALPRELLHALLNEGDDGLPEDWRSRLSGRLRSPQAHSRKRPMGVEAFLFYSWPFR